MLYIVLAVILIIAVVVIFRDDHDRSYDRREKAATMSRQVREQPIQEIPAPRDKTAVTAPKPAVPDYTSSEQPLTWSFLYSLEYDGSLVEDTFVTRIAGLWYNCSVSDAGPVNGTVRPEPYNQHDPRAQVVIRADGKKLGYIPRDVLDLYGIFNEKNLVCPFAGKITVGRKGYMKADIVVALPKSREFVKEALSR